METCTRVLRVRRSTARSFCSQTSRAHRPPTPRCCRAGPAHVLGELRSRGPARTHSEGPRATHDCAGQAPASPARAHGESGATTREVGCGPDPLPSAERWGPEGGPGDGRQPCPQGPWPPMIVQVLPVMPPRHGDRHVGPGGSPLRGSGLGLQASEPRPGTPVPTEEAGASAEGATQPSTWRPALWGGDPVTFPPVPLCLPG